MNKLLNNIKIGQDPEVFLFDNTNNEIISAIGIIPGEKFEPEIIGAGFAIQTDNILFEYNVPPVSIDNPEEMFKNHQFVWDYVKERYLAKDISIKIQASEIIDDKYLNNKQARLFGCDPSLNCWTETFNEKPDNNTNLRSCGGHVHIGYDNPSMEINIELCKALDLFLGVPSIVLDTTKGSAERKKLYGQAGEMRHANHGLEYRVLSNFHIQSLEYTSWLFKNIQQAIDFINSGYRVSNEESKDIIDIINNNNIELCREYVEKYSINMDVKQFAKVINYTYLHD